MLIKTEVSNDIISFLESELITNVNILGIIKNVPEADIYVDNIKEPKGVLVRNGYFNYIYCLNNDFVDEVCNTCFLEGFHGFSGVKEWIADRIKKKFHVDWDNPCSLYYLPKENLNLELKKRKTRLIPLDAAEVVDKYYTYRGDGSLDRIKKDILDRPSSAVYEDGELVSWVLTHEDNSMGIMYTKKQYRRHGYAIDVTIDLASKLIKKGQIPYVHIVKGNVKSEKLAEKCGFVKHGSVIWFGIEVR